MPPATYCSVSRALATQVTEAIECTVVPIWVTSPGVIFDGIGASVSLTRLNQDAAPMCHQQVSWFEVWSWEKTNHGHISRGRPWHFRFFKRLARYALFKYFGILLESVYSVLL